MKADTQSALTVALVFVATLCVCSALQCHVCSSETEIHCQNLTEAHRTLYVHDCESEKDGVTYKTCLKMVTEGWKLSRETEKMVHSSTIVRRMCSSQDWTGCSGEQGSNAMRYECNCEGDKCNHGSKMAPPVEWLLASLTSLWVVVKRIS